MPQWFQPGEGIAREVITADIQRYLGQDALVKPGERDGVPGYLITAYRNLTTAMVIDLKADSQRWRAEQGRGSPYGRDAHHAKHPDKALGSYQESQIHASRQYHGPSGEKTAPAPVYQQPQPSQPPRQPYPSQPQQHHQYPPAQAPEPAYTYTQPTPGYPSQPATSPYAAPAYSQSGQLPRTQPAYSYPSPSPGQDSHQYPPPQQPYGGYSHTQPSPNPPTSHYQAPPPQQPSAAPGYYIASDGRQYPIQSNATPPQPANHGRRRG